MSPKTRVQRWLHLLFDYFAILIGTTCYRYDFKRRLYRKTKWSQIIASLANLIVIVYILMDLYNVWMQSLETVTDLTIRWDTTLNDIICLMRVLQRLPREKVTNAIAQELRRLQRIYRFRVGERRYEKEPHLEGIWLLKHCHLWVQLAFFTGFMQLTQDLFGMQLNNILCKRAMVVIYVLALDGQTVAMQIHFHFTWRICGCFMWLNERIELLLRQTDAASLMELHHIRWQHWQLGRLWHRLNIAYNFILISSRLSLIVTAAALGYYISVFRSLQNQFIGFGLCAFIVLDAYMNDLIYDLTVNAYLESTWSMWQRNELNQGNVQLARAVNVEGICSTQQFINNFFQCELLALQIANFPLQIKPYALFASGRATLLSNIACIISWMVVLLQYRMVSERNRN